MWAEVIKPGSRGEISVVYQNNKHCKVHTGNTAIPASKTSGNIVHLKLMFQITDTFTKQKKKP